MRAMMLAALLTGLCAPVLAQQTDTRPSVDQRSGAQPQPSRPDAAGKDREKSSSATNTPTTGEPSGRSNPSVSTAPDNAPSRGSVRPQ